MVWPVPLSWSAHWFFAGEEGFGYVTFSVARCLGKETKTISLIVMAYTASFNNVEKLSYLAMEFGSFPENRVLARVLPWLAVGDFHLIM